MKKLFVYVYSAAAVLLLWATYDVKSRVQAPELSFYTKWTTEYIALKSATNRSEVTCFGEQYHGEMLLPHVSLTGLFGSCKTYLIMQGNGGNEWVHLQAAKELTASDSTARIDGPCYSGCVTFADKARARVCITPRASFHIHKGYQWVRAFVDGRMRNVQTGFVDQALSKDIDAWVRKQPKGYRIDGFTHMPYDVAKGFWRECEQSAPVPLPRSNPRKGAAAAK